jgi:hypothetical protein
MMNQISNKAQRFKILVSRFVAFILVDYLASHVLWLFSLTLIILAWRFSLLLIILAFCGVSRCFCASLQVAASPSVDE